MKIANHIGDPDLSTKWKKGIPILKFLSRHSLRGKQARINGTLSALFFLDHVETDELLLHCDKLSGNGRQVKLAGAPRVLLNA